MGGFWRLSPMVVVGDGYTARRVRRGGVPFLSLVERYSWQTVARLGLG